MEKVTSSRLFLVFLLTYLAILAEHAISDFSWEMLGGFAIAVLAHSRRNKITLLLLVSHMVIEWFEWGSGKAENTALMINVGHAVLDFTFLRHELIVHSPKYTGLILVGVSVILLAVFLASSQVSVPEAVIESIHPIVLGGVVGCVLSHLTFHLTKE